MQPIELRPLTPDEAVALERLAHSRRAPTRAVERAQLVWQAHRGALPGEIAATCGVDPEAVWIRRRDIAG